MSRIYRSLPPQGTPNRNRSSPEGLDTRYRRRLDGRGTASRSMRTPPISRSPTRRTSPIFRSLRPAMHGAKVARLVDCREALAREGVVALQCGAFHLSNGGKKYFNTTPLRRAVTTTAIIRAMREDGVNVFSDGSSRTQGNDIQRFFRYGVSP